MKSREVSRLSCQADEDTGSRCALPFSSLHFKLPRAEDVHLRVRCWSLCIPLSWQCRERLNFIELYDVFWVCYANTGKIVMLCTCLTIIGCMCPTCVYIMTTMRLILVCVCSLYYQTDVSDCMYLLPNVRDWNELMSFCGGCVCTCCVW